MSAILQRLAYWRKCYQCGRRIAHGRWCHECEYGTWVSADIFFPDQGSAPVDNPDGLSDSGSPTPTR